MPYVPAPRAKFSASSGDNIKSDNYNSSSLEFTSPSQTDDALSSIGRKLSELNNTHKNNALNISALPIETKKPETKMEIANSNADEKSGNNSNINRESELFRRSSFDDQKHSKLRISLDDDNMPLSLSFLKKPSRSSSMDLGVDVNKIMKQNTLMNSKSFDNVKHVKNPNITIDSNIDDPVSPVSPLASITTIDSSSSNYHYPLIRKKSGELVKSSLKLNSSFRSSGAVSMPTTPTYKQVHFGNNINVKYFKEKDKPNSISADNSPFNSETEMMNDGDYDYNDESNEEILDLGSDSDDSDSENGNGTVKNKNVNYFGFSNNLSEESNYCHDKLFQSCKKYVEMSSPVRLEKFKAAMKNWNLDLSDFQSISYRDKIDCEVPVFLERVFLNLDKTLIIGQIAVKNISFSKSVKIRYTVDNWKTIVNVICQFTSDIPRVLKRAGYDRFIFQISTPVLLSSYFKANPDSFNKSPIVYFCVKFSCGGQDYWDNNNRNNYTLRFFNNKLFANDKLETNNIDSLQLTSPTPKKQMSNNFARNLNNSKPNYENNQKDLTAKHSEPSKSVEGTVTKSASSFSNKSIKRSRSFDMRNNIKALISSPELTVKDDHKYHNNDSPTLISLNNKRLNDELKIGKNNTEAENNIPENSISIIPSGTPNNKLSTEDPLSDADLGKQSLKEVFLNASGNVPRPDNRMNLNTTESGSYKDLLDKYCFFKGPDPISSFLTDNKDSTDSGNIYSDKFY